jgi:hypothetical protein
MSLERFTELNQVLTIILKNDVADHTLKRENIIIRYINDLFNSLYECRTPSKKIQHLDLRQVKIYPTNKPVLQTQERNKLNLSNKSLLNRNLYETFKS